MFDARDGFAVLPLGDARPIPDIFGGGGIELMVLLVEDLSDGNYRQREGGSYRLALRMLSVGVSENYCIVSSFSKTFVATKSTSHRRQCNSTHRHTRPVSVFLS
jgi:hypothetical protein